MSIDASASLDHVTSLKSGHRFCAACGCEMKLQAVSTFYWDRIAGERRELVTGFLWVCSLETEPIAPERTRFQSWPQRHDEVSVELDTKPFDDRPLTDRGVQRP